MMLSTLIIEKDPQFRRVCQMVLTKGGYHLSLAETLVDGLRALEQSHGFSAILISTELDAADIRDVLRGLEKRPHTQDIPVIVLAPAGSDFGDLREQFPAVLNVLYKPLGPALILQSLNQALRIGEVPFIHARRETLKKTVIEPRKSLPPVVEKKPIQTTRVAFQGNLELMPLPEIMQLLYFQKHTGCLRIVCDLQEVRLFFSGGQIQWAISRNFKKEFRLGRVLVISKSLEPERLREALVKKNGNKAPLGQYLIENQVIDADKLHTALRDQTCQIVYESLRWTKGVFAFEVMQDLPHLAKEAQLNIPIEGLILEGCRRLDEWNHLYQQLGCQQFTVHRNPKGPGDDTRLTHAERAILGMAQEPLAIDVLSEKLFLPSFEIYKICHRLIQHQFLLQS